MTLLLHTTRVQTAKRFLWRAYSRGKWHLMKGVKIDKTKLKNEMSSVSEVTHPEVLRSYSGRSSRVPTSLQTLDVPGLSLDWELFLGGFSFFSFSTGEFRRLHDAVDYLSWTHTFGSPSVKTDKQKKSDQTEVCNIHSSPFRKWRKKLNRHSDFCLFCFNVQKTAFSLLICTVLLKNANLCWVVFCHEIIWRF